jgi:hypothetical protein
MAQSCKVLYHYTEHHGRYTQDFHHHSILLEEQQMSKMEMTGHAMLF